MLKFMAQNFSGPIFSVNPLLGRNSHSVKLSLFMLIHKLYLWLMASENRPFSQFNLNSLRVFRSVYKAGSMSLAAHALHLTQPGVSQHIKTLETSLGVQLFNRIKNRLVPTSRGHELFEACELSIKTLEEVTTHVKEGKGSLMGEIRIGMPTQFGVNQLMPLLCEFGEAHPKVTFKITFDFATNIEEALLKGDLDIGIVDEIKFSPKLSSTKIFQENLEVCVHESLIKNISSKKLDANTYQSLPYLEYIDSRTLIHRWFWHHFKVRKPHVKVRATVSDLQAVMKLISGKMGAGILPDYLFVKLRKECPEVVKLKGGGTPLSNTLSLVFLKERDQSPAVEKLIQRIRASI